LDGFGVYQDLMEIQPLFAEEQSNNSYCAYQRLILRLWSGEMSKTLRFLAKWRVLGVMMAVLGASAPVHAQTLVCKGWRDIESEPGQPFTAQRVSHNVMHYPDGSEHTELLNSDVARGSNGRVYSEWHFDRNASAVPEKTNQTPGDSSSNRA
jgi:hypothetical protein